MAILTGLTFCCYYFLYETRVGGGGLRWKPLFSGGYCSFCDCVSWMEHDGKATTIRVSVVNTYLLHLDTCLKSWSIDEAKRKGRGSDEFACRGSIAFVGVDAIIEITIRDAMCLIYGPLLCKGKFAVCFGVAVMPVLSPRAITTLLRRAAS